MRFGKMAVSGSIIMMSIIAALSSSVTPGAASGDRIVYFPHFADGGGYSTTWYFTGLSSEAGVVTIELFDQSGFPLTVATNLGTSSIFRIAPMGGSAAATLVTLGSGTGVKVGWAQVTATQSIGAAETLRLVGPGGTLMAESVLLPSTLAGSVTLFVPDPGNTALALANVDASPVTLNFRLLDSSGVTIAAGTQNLAAGNQLARYVNQLPGLGAAAVTGGTLDVTASAPVSLNTLVFEGRTFSALPVLPGRIADRPSIVNQLRSLRQQMEALDDELLGPSQSDILPYTSFLAQPETGITRLLPRGQYDDLFPYLGGGAYFGFVSLSHDYEAGADVELQQNSLSTGFAGYDYGFITSLGDVPIESASATSAGVPYLTSYVPPATDAAIRAEQQRSGTGFTSGGTYYCRRMTATISTTYVLRSISYRRSDVLVALRVLRFDTDGSVVFVWKKLATFPVPTYQ